MELIEHSGAEGPATIRYSKHEFEMLQLLLAHAKNMDNEILSGVSDDQIDSLQKKILAFSFSLADFVHITLSGEEWSDISSLLLQASNGHVDAYKGQGKKFLEMFRESLNINLEIRPVPGLAEEMKKLGL